MRLIIFLIVILLTGCSSTKPVKPRESLRIRLFDTYAIVDNADELSVVEPLSTDSINSMPKAILEVEPEYTFSGLVAEQNALVWVKVLILPSGNVKEARIISSTNNYFNKNVLKAAVMWQFRPAVENGKAIEFWASIPFKFKYKK